jgi:hypothetical protein
MYCMLLVGEQLIVEPSNFYCKVVDCVSETVCTDEFDGALVVLKDWCGRCWWQ